MEAGIELGQGNENEPGEGEGESESEGEVGVKVVRSTRSACQGHPTGRR